MNTVGFVKGVYGAFGAGDVPRVLGSMHPQIQWTAGHKIVRFDQYVDSATINPIIGA